MIGSEQEAGEALERLRGAGIAGLTFALAPVCWLYPSRLDVIATNQQAMRCRISPAIVMCPLWPKLKAALGAFSRGEREYHTEDDQVILMSE